MADHDSVLAPLDGTSSTLFLVAGGLLVVFAALMGYEALVDSSVNFADNEADVFGPAGFAVGFVGLLGLYPGLADRSPNLARASAVFAAMGAAGFTVVAAKNLVDIVGIGFPSALKFMMILAFVGFLGAFPLIGVTSLRTDVHSRTLGLLLLAPVAVFALMLSGAVNMVVGDGLARFILSSGQAVSFLAIGVALRAGKSPRDRAEPAPDATV